MKYVVGLSILGCWLGDGLGLAAGVAAGLLLDDVLRRAR